MIIFQIFSTNRTMILTLVHPSLYALLMESMFASSFKIYWSLWLVLTSSWCIRCWIPIQFLNIKFQWFQTNSTSLLFQFFYVVLSFNIIFLFRINFIIKSIIFWIMRINLIFLNIRIFSTVLTFFKLVPILIKHLSVIIIPTFLSQEKLWMLPLYK